MVRKVVLGLVTLGVVWGGELPAQTSGTGLRPEPTEPNTRLATRGANFLEIGVDARAMAMAGAYTALAEGTSALYWNTAGIAEEARFGVSVSSAQLYGDFDIRHLFGGVVIPLGDGAVGVSVTSLSSGEITRTTEEFPEGGAPEVGATFEWTAQAAALHYARRITDRLLAGAAVKVAREGVTDANAQYVGVDVGIRFRTGLYGTTLGGSLSNVGSSGRMRGPALERRFQASEVFVGGGIAEVEFNTRPMEMPTIFRFSVMTDLVGGADALVTPSARNSLIAVVDFADAIDTDLQTAVGVEYSYSELFFVRLGKRWVNERRTGGFREASHGLSFGGGLRVPVLGETPLYVDYAYVNMGELDNTQILTLRLGW